MNFAPKSQGLPLDSGNDSAIRQARAERDVGTPPDSPDPAQAASLALAHEVLAELSEKARAAGYQRRQHRPPTGGMLPPTEANAASSAVAAARSAAVRARHVASMAAQQREWDARRAADLAEHDARMKRREAGS